MYKSCTAGIALVLLCPPLSIAADEVQLKSGAVANGIIERETDQLIDIRTPLGIVGIGREFIAEVRRASPEENAALEREWARAEAAAAAQREARRNARALEQAAAEAFAEAQRAKGLVFFDDEWITLEEADLRLRAVRHDELRARLAELDREVESWRVRAAAAEARTEMLGAQVERLEAHIADRDARIAALGDEIDDRDRHLAALFERLAHAQHLLRICRARRPPSP